MIDTPQSKINLLPTDSKGTTPANENSSPLPTTTTQETTIHSQVFPIPTDKNPRQSTSTQKSPDTTAPATSSSTTEGTTPSVKPIAKPKEVVKHYHWISFEKDDPSEVDYLKTFLKTHENKKIDYSALDIKSLNPNPSDDPIEGKKDPLQSMIKRINVFGNLDPYVKHRKKKDPTNVYDRGDSWIDDSEFDPEQQERNIAFLTPSYEDFVCIKGSIKDFLESEYLANRMAAVKNADIKATEEESEKKPAASGASKKTKDDKSKGVKKSGKEPSRESKENTDSKPKKDGKSKGGEDKAPNGEKAKADEKSMNEETPKTDEKEKTEEEEKKDEKDKDAKS